MLKAIDMVLLSGRFPAGRNDDETCRRKLQTSLWPA